MALYQHHVCIILCDDQNTEHIIMHEHVHVRIHVPLRTDKAYQMLKAHSRVALFKRAV